MSKVLVADDSLTIQKVIGITLANSGYELVECLNENDLLSKVKSNQYDLILLDFNLSDSKSGYELAKEIHKHQNTTPILVLLGTFDTIEENKFKENGISDKIVKPFESSKFIKKCKQLIEEQISSPLDTFLETQEEGINTDDHKSAEDFSDLDSWTVDAPKKLELEPNENSTQSAESISGHFTADPLANEIQGWGFQQKSADNFPGVIGEENFSQIVMPEAIKNESSTPNSQAIFQKLQAASNFNLDDDEDVVQDVTDPHMTITDDKRVILEAVDEDLSPDSFWAVDDVQPVQSEELYRLDSPQLNLGESTTDLTETVEQFKKAAPSQTISNVSINEDKIISELKAHLTPLIEKWVKEACSETVEKVAWDVIPDLAENLIRKEIKELSESVRH